MDLIIDISKYNTGTFDWQKVKMAVSGVIIRCGYRGYGSGKIVADPKAHDFAKACVQHDIPIGFYFMSQAITNEEAIEEAAYLISYADKYKAKLPLFIDSEDGDGTEKVVRADSLSKRARTDICKAFCETLISAGYVGGVYASEDWFRNRLYYDELKNYYMWVARYGENNGKKTKNVELPKCDMHQYTSKATVDGVPGRVDISEVLVASAPAYYSVPEFTLIDSLNKIGVNSSYSNRKKIASANGVQNYTGTAEQNMKLLSLLNGGKLKKI